MLGYLDTKFVARAFKVALLEIKQLLDNKLFECVETEMVLALPPVLEAVLVFGRFWCPAVLDIQLHLQVIDDLRALLSGLHPPLGWVIAF